MNNIFTGSEDSSYFLYQAFEFASRDYLYIWDISGGDCIVSENIKNALELPGTCLNHFNKLWPGFVHPCDVPRIERELKTLLDGGKDHLDLECRVRIASGRYVWVNCRGLLKKSGGDGRPMTLAGAIHKLESYGRMPDHITGLFGREEMARYFESAALEIKDGTISAQLLELKERFLDALKQAERKGEDHCVFTPEMLPEETGRRDETFLQYPAADGGSGWRQMEGDSDLLLSLMNSMPLCLNLWNRNSEILACNNAVLRLFGAADPDDFRDNFYKFSPEIQPDGAPSEDKVRQLVKQAFEEKELSFFWMHCRETGEEIPTEVYFVRIPYYKDYVVVSYTRDMREQIANEERAQRFNSRLQSILNASPLCLNLWNRRYENSMCNQAAVKLFDLGSKEEYIEKFYRLSPRCQPGGRFSAELSEEYIRKAFEDGYCQFRWMHRKPDGEDVPAEITLVRIDGLDDDGNDMVAGFTRDLRYQLRAERKERSAAQRIKAVLDAMPLTCLLWNLEWQVLDCNQAAVTMFEAENKEDVILHFDRFLPETQPDGSLSIAKKQEKFSEVMESSSCAFEWVYQSSTKEAIPSAVSMMMLHTDDGDVIVAYSQDLRELQETLAVNKQLQQMAYYDWLTGSVSRARFMQNSTECFKNLLPGEAFALMIFDFDDFKSLNDTYGHESGDIVLSGVVRKIMSLLPAGALLGRYGGDEFMIQIKGMEYSSLNLWLTDMMRAVREMRFFHAEKMLKTTISVGGAFFKPDDAVIETLLNRADDALYEAKRCGRNCSVLQ